MGRGCALLRRPALDRARREHRLTDRVGAAGPARGRRPGRGDGEGRSLARGHAAAGRRLGRAAVHRHGVPLRLLHQLPPLQDQLPADGARALPGFGAGGIRQRQREPGGASPEAHPEPGVRIHPMAGQTPSGAIPRLQEPPSAPSADAVMARAQTENFPVASRLLARAEREHLLAVYGLARLVDELGDAPEIPSADRLGALDWLEAELDAALAGRATDPLMVRLGRTIAACHLPREPFTRLIEANRLDQRRERYETWEDLRSYCALSADPVGEIVLGVFGRHEQELIALSDRICTALQLAEHCQDVAE